MKKKKETIAQLALRLIKGIPAKKFITGRYTDGHSNCCVIGHFQRLTSKNTKDYSLENCSDHTRGALRELSRDFLKDDTNISTVNNRPTGKYQQIEPKSRVVACLKDMVAAGL